MTLNTRANSTVAGVVCFATANQSIGKEVRGPSTGSMLRLPFGSDGRGGTTCGEAEPATGGLSTASKSRTYGVRRPDALGHIFLAAQESTSSRLLNACLPEIEHVRQPAATLQSHVD